MNARTGLYFSLADFLAWEESSVHRRVIEVLSPSTPAYARSQKFAFCRRLDCLREYILVDPDTHRVEGFVETATGSGRSTP